MPTSTRDENWITPQPTRPRWTAAGVVEAPVEQVWEALLAINPYLSVDDRQAIEKESGPLRFTANVGYARIVLEVDKQRHSITDQGEWWYRGTQSVEPHQRGSLLVYRVYNIAPAASRWLVPFVVRNFDAVTRERLQQTLRTLGERLHCRTTLVSGHTSA